MYAGWFLGRRSRCLLDSATRGARGYARGAEKTPERPKPSGQKSTEGKGDSKKSIILKALEPKKVVTEKLSPEQLLADRQRAKEYSRNKMAEHRAWQTGLRDKIQVQWAAIAALPADLRAAALVPDDVPIPPSRQLPMETAPIKGWFERKQADAEDMMKTSSALGGGKRR